MLPIKAIFHSGALKPIIFTALNFVMFNSINAEAKSRTAL